MTREPTRFQCRTARWFADVLSVAMAALVATACVPAGHGSGSGEAANGSLSDTLRPNAVVREVIDGDTIVVESRGDSEHVRLIGVDTPETVHPTKPVGCFGKEASTYTKGLLPKGTAVHLRRDIEARDRYGRLLAYVYRASDGLFVNMDLVSTGHGRAYRFPPNVTLAAAFSRAQAAARQSGAGLWSECTEVGSG